MAKKIVAVSEYTRQDVIRQYNLDPAKIETVYNGFDLDENSQSTIFVEDIFQQHQLRAREYFIFIGAVHPRKNVLGILRAFELFKQKSNSKHKLLLIGRDAWLNDDLRSELNRSSYKTDIVWIPEIERSSLLKLLQLSYALVFPSFFEGFGIPVLEAMKLGVPVITSNVSALPEVAGDAALLCDPNSPKSIAAEMSKLQADPTLYQILVENGKRQAQQFSWDKSAAQWAAIIRQELAQIKTAPKN